MSGKSWKSTAAVLLASGALCVPLAATATTATTAGTGASTATATHRVTPECGNGDLVASYRATDAGVGHRYGVLKLSNVSGHTCVVQGYGGLSYVGHGNGTQVGAAADRDRGRATRVVLRPGEHARSLVDEVVAQNYPRRRCHPTRVDGFRVYAPDSRTSQFVKHPTIGCAHSRVHLVTHRAYR